VKYRQDNGGFKSVDELTQVPGFGKKSLAALKPLVTVGTMGQ
jgi:DNA uptake protein ComE-like DNA-binding protein